MVAMYERELACLELRLYGQMQMERKAICTGEGQKMSQFVQTEIKAVGKNIDLVAKGTKPFRYEKEEIPTMSVGTTTDLDAAVLKYILKAAETHEKDLTAGKLQRQES